MTQFDHDKLDVYHAAIDFFAIANQVIAELPRGVASLQTSCLGQPCRSVPTSRKELVNSAVMPRRASIGLLVAQRPSVPRFSMP